MNSDRKLILSDYRKKLTLIAEDTIKELFSMNDKAMLLSGEDSGLRNVWEEICVQVQGENSYFIQQYDNCIISTIELCYAKQSDAFKADIKFVQDAKISRVPVVAAVFSIINRKAKFFKNPRISTYLSE
ncbi:MAG: hypothetical protein R2809_05155 [Flavobacteriales bacterium]